MKIYFETPTQVKLWDPTAAVGSVMSYGAIAYKDELICGRDGDIISIRDYLKSCMDANVEFIDMYNSTGNTEWLDALPKQYIEVFGEWVNISDYILFD